MFQVELRYTASDIEDAQSADFSACLYDVGILVARLEMRSPTSYRYALGHLQYPRLYIYQDMGEKYQSISRHAKRREKEKRSQRTK